jgi:hypothetical protein
MLRIALFLSYVLLCSVSLSFAQGASVPEYAKKHAQPFGLSVSASVASTKVFPQENLVALDVTLKNNGQVPIIFESCECSFSNLWISDNPLVTVKKSSECAQNDCTDVELLPGQEMVRQISLHMAPESLSGYHQKIDFKIGFRLWDIPGSMPYWSNLISIEREE